MEDDKKTKSSAPSSDTTSALFVSARKKQLEQQEAEKRAKEKEEQRLAAEAEVRCLEAEVQERRRKAEEEARRVEQEAEKDAQRIAEEARLKKERAAEDPDAVLGAPAKKELKIPQMPNLPKLPAGDLFKNKKLLGIIGALLLVLIVGVTALGGDDEDPAANAAKGGAINADAKLDKVVNIPFLAMNVSYPSAVFKAGDQAEKSLVIEDIHGDGASFMALVTDIPYNSGSKDFNLYRNFLKEAVNSALSGQKNISLGKLMDRPASKNNSYAGSIMDAAYTDAKSGQAMTVSVELSFRTNQKTKDTYLVMYMLSYPENKPAYEKLLNAIKESRKNA